MTKTQSSPTLSPKPRFKTESEIITLIDAKMETARQAEIESWRLDRLALQYLEETAKAKRDSEAYALVKDAKECRSKADKLRLKAKAILEIHLPKLKQKLSVMRTPQMPALGNGDASMMR